LTILAKKISHLKIPEAKSQRREKNTLGEPLKSAQISSHEKSNYILWMPLKTLQISKEPLNYIKAKE
jgi:hypothetical protein